jgi:hypothetical protein
MLAAAGTLWITFGFWIAAPLLGVPRPITRTAAVLLVLELVTLLGASYGCEDGRCTAPASAAGAAARTDLPVLTLVFLVVVAWHGWRALTRANARHR